MTRKREVESWETAVNLKNNRSGYVPEIDAGNATDVVILALKEATEAGVKKNVHRGGSFLCTDQYCARYMAGGRGKDEPETGTNHVGFRLVRDVDKQKAARS